MLAVSTMAVFYAAPVMAAEFTLDSNSSVTTETTTSTGGYTQNEVRVNIDDGVNGSQTIGTFYSNEMEAGFKTDYTMTASTFTLEAGGKTWASLTVDGLTYTNQTTLNNVRLTADGLTFSNLRNPEDAAVLNAAAINSWNEKTQNINAKETVAGKTYFDGKVIADKFGTSNGAFYVDENGTIKGNSLIIGKNGDNAVFKVDRNGNTEIKGNVTMAKDATVDGVDVSALGATVEGTTADITDLQNKTQNMYAGRNYTTFKGSLSTEGSISSGNGAVQLRGNWGQEAAIDLRDTNNNYATLTATQLANINNVVQENGNVVANSLNVANGAFEVTNDGTVNGPGNFTIYNNGVMYAPDGGTIGGVIFNNDGSVAGTHFSIAANGEITATNFNAGSYNLVDVGNDLTELQGTVDGTTADITALEQKTAGINKSGAVTTVEGVAFAQGHMDADAVVTDELTVNGLSNLDGVRVDNGSIYADNDSYVGGVQLADGLVNGVNMDNLRGIERETYADGSGMTTIEGATSFDQGGMSINTSTGTTAVSGGVATFRDNNGSFTQIMGGDITAETLNGKNIDEMFDTVTETNANVGGIKRIDSNGDGTLDTTTIEDILSVSSDQILAQTGSSQLVITEDVAGLSSGNASFALSNNELQLSVAGNGLLVNQFGTNLNGIVNFIGHDGNSYTLANLEGRVYDLEQKTQNITSADPGQGGGSEVPPTDEGHTGFEGDVTVGGDINADEGNFNKVNTDEITVGDSTFIDGDSVNSNEGNFKDKVTVGGEGGTSITGDGMTVGTADKGTTVSDSGVSIKNEYGSVETGVVDGKNDVVVTDEDGNRTSLVDTAGRVDNLEQGVAELNNRVGELEDRIDKVGAMAAAIANLRTMGYDPAAPTEVAVGIGQYRDETGAALGLFHYPNRDFMLSLSVSTSGDEVMGGIGATWKFGRKSPEKVAEIKKAQAEADVRRAEEAKLAKAEEMKQAAKEAKIKAQQERHAKLAAERAAQAEAAK